jgi:class 3 adenylate cyclase/tetratricopeptide (TPR) repeat protein
MDVVAWLRGLGLEQYEQAFRDNGIDAEILAKLTVEDLKDIGVTRVGDRRKLLEAIAALCEGALRSPVVEQPSEVPGSVAGPLSEAECRQLTVMFCDLVGSTALSARFDPEDLREVIGAYHRCVADAVTRFAGFVAKYMGDGVLVYFGYPEAHEDDAERAVRSGLGLIDAVGRLDVKSVELQARVGIATGLVVVGDLIGEGSAREQSVVGETPNRAARLQALASPGTLVVDAGARRQIGGLFELEDLGAQPLAGFAVPQPAWRVIGESGVVSRFEALRAASFTPLVGREEELDLLLRRWWQAKAGEGRVVLISGEPGIGKSRLAAALRERLEGEELTRLRYFCSPHHQDSALYPFIAQLERAAGFEREDPVEEKLDKLEALLAPGARDRDETTLVAELLSLPNEAATLNLSPQRKREALFEALLHQFEAVARARPVLMVFEDAHWIDPTSRELMDLTIDRVRRLPVLLVVTFRPEFQHGWGGQPHVTMLALNRLGERDVTALVRELAGNAPLRSEVVEEIVERTDGVPLFVEELTKAVLEGGGEHNRVAPVLSASPLPALAVPPTLHASLIARVDRLGTAAKEVAQIGAVLGREFTYELIEPVAQRGANEMQAALTRLAEAGLLFCRGTPPHASYLFKHALVQDAAYGTLLRGRRQELHARVAAVLEEDFTDVIERQPELLAHHLTMAGNTVRAVDQWLKAGQVAAARLAHREAIRHFDRGLALLGSLPDGSARDGQETELQLARGLSLFTTEGFISKTAAEAYTRARALAERRNDDRQLVMAIYGQWQGTGWVRTISVGRGLSQKLLGLTAAAADRGLRLQAHHTAWATCLLGGEPAAGREHCEAGRQLYDPDEHRSHRLLFGGHDPGVCALQFGSHCEWVLGYPDKALASGNEAVDLAERIAHPLSLDFALAFGSMLHLDRGEPDLALRQVAAMEALAAEQRLAIQHSPGVIRGAALLMQGAVGDATAVLREALDTPAGRAYSRPLGLAALAKALALRGEPAAAIALIGDAMAMMQATGHHQLEPEFHRLKGIALLDQNKLAEGESALQEAIRVARRRHMRAYELRAATSLARLWGEQGRRTEARELLAPVYDWFTEGFDTADLKEAKALLDKLA